MVTFSTWQIVGLVVAVMVFYTVTLVVAAKVIGKGLSAKLLYLIPIYPMDTAKRIYAISRQLGVPEDDISYMGKSIFNGKSQYYIKSTEQIVTLESFFGVVVKTMPDGEILTSEYHAYSSESLTQQHNYIVSLKEQGLEPEVKGSNKEEQHDEVVGDDSDLATGNTEGEVVKVD